jgi:hypothetical protein
MWEGIRVWGACGRAARVAFCQGKCGFGRSVAWQGSAHLHLKSPIWRAPTVTVSAFCRHTRPSSSKASNGYLARFMSSSNLNRCDCTHCTCAHTVPHHQSSRCSGQMGRQWPSWTTLARLYRAHLPGRPPPSYSNESAKMTPRGVYPRMCARPG